MRFATLVRWSTAGLFLVAALAWIAVRRFGVLPPWVVAVAAGAAAGCAAAALAADVARLGADRSVVTMARALVFAGMLFAGGVGLLGWVRSIQGFVMLAEREPVRVRSPDDLQKFWGGPLRSIDDLRGTLVLEKLVLEPEGGGFRPISRVSLRREGGGLQTIEVSTGSSATVGQLSLYQGAFGFAPRIVVLRDGRTILDENVPFRTGVLGERAVVFEGELEIVAEGLHVRGEVDLSSLDDRMRGHPTLHLRLEKDGKEIGSGQLRPGGAADLRDGYRVVYAGMRRWSEIDVRRRGVAGWVRGGLGAAVLGLLIWPLAVWRRW